MLEPLLKPVIALAKEAGVVINAYYQAETINAIHTKPDKSPLTQADLAAHQLITEGLQKLTPDWPVLSEEGEVVPFSERAQWEPYWLIDPLDGTKDFLEKNHEFSVNIALIKNYYPVLGVVYAPALATCYYASVADGAFKQVKTAAPQRLKTRKNPPHVTIAVSRHHGHEKLQDFIKQFQQPEIIVCGSALKFCLVAEGTADIYPRLGPTSEWDTAAAQCVLEQAGGAVVNNTGARLCYNTKESLLNPNFFAVGDIEANWKKYFTGL